MSVEAVKSAIESSIESPTDLLVLLLLADHLNSTTGLCYPSIPTLAEECRRDERSIFRSLKRLEEQGHISRDSRRGLGRSNHYRIHPQGRRKKKAKPEPGAPSEEDQNLTPVSPFDDGEKVTNLVSKPDTSVTQKVTNLVSKPDTSVTLTGSNRDLTVTNPKVDASGFEEFWNRYPKRKAKVDALNAWNQTSKVRPDNLLKILERHKLQEQWTKNQGQFIPNPATWLRKQRWTDEITTTKQGTRKPETSHRNY